MITLFIIFPFIQNIHDKIKLFFMVKKTTNKIEK